MARRADDLRRQRVGREYLVGHQTAPIQERYVEHAVVTQSEKKGADTVFNDLADAHVLRDPYVNMKLLKTYSPIIQVHARTKFNKVMSHPRS